MAKQTTGNTNLSLPFRGTGGFTGGQGAGEYLFVYGTLRKDFHRQVIKLPENDFTYFAQGKVSASLYDLGNYPAAIKATNTDSVSGDVFEITDGASVFAILDEYEGEEYRREKTTVTLTSGAVIDAWMYWYIGTVDKAAPIANGDYLAHLKKTMD